MKFTVENLAKFKIGQTIYRAQLVPKDITIKSKEDWMDNHHPKIYFDRKVCYFSKHAAVRPPFTDATSFEALTYILTSKLTYTKFEVSEIQKCLDTGEIKYKCHDSEDWMPESCLFALRADAAKECKRIKGLLTKWIGDEL